MMPPKPDYSIQLKKLKDLIEATNDKDIDFRRTNSNKA